MSVEDWNGLRKTWVKARDAAQPRVAMGAVKGVSMGEGIDAVYKAGQRDYTTLVAVTTKFLTDAAKYQAAIKAKNPDLATWIEKNLVTRGKALVADAQADGKKLQDGIKFYGNFNARREAYIPGNLVKLGADAAAANKALKVTAPEAYKGLLAWHKFYKSIGDMLDKTAHELKLDVRKGQVVKSLQEIARSIGHDTRIFDTIVKAAEGPGFSQALRTEVSVPDRLWDLAKDGYVTMTKALKA